MSRPRVELANHEAVYGFYEAYRPSMAGARFGHAVLSQIYPVTLDFAEGARGDIRSLAADGAGFAISSNHLSDRDQFMLASFPTEDEALAFLMGHTRIPAKEAVQNAPLPALGREIVRRGADMMGAVPAFRVKDRFDGIERSDRDPAEAKLQQAASEGLKRVLVQGLLEGDHIVSFDEGERNRVNLLEVQPLKRGRVDIVEAVRAADPSIEIATMPIAMYYPQSIVDGKLKLDYRHPVVHVGRPITEPVDTLEKLETVLRPALQENLDTAVEMVKDRDGEEAVLPEDELINVLKAMADERRRQKLERAAAKAA